MEAEWSARLAGFNEAGAVKPRRLDQAIRRAQY